MSGNDSLSSAVPAPASTTQPSVSLFKGSILSPDEKLQNGNFESGKTGWADFGNTEVLPGIGHNGSSGLHLLGSAAGGVQQT